MAARDGIHIVLAGGGGCGKSATANTLCGENYFKSKCSTFPVTKCFQRKVVLNAADHTQLVIVDSPALFDIYDDENIVSKELALCLDLAYSKIDILLVVVPLNERFTSKDKELFEQIESVFGNSIRKNIVVCFSYEDELKKKNVNMNSYLERSPAILVDLVKRYDYRYLPIDNTQNSDQQRQNMIGILMKLIKEFEYCSYTMKDMIKWKEKLQKKRLKIEQQFEDDERTIAKKYEPIIDDLKKKEKKQRTIATERHDQFPKSKFDGHGYKDDLRKKEKKQRTIATERHDQFPKSKFDGHGYKGAHIATDIQTTDKSAEISSTDNTEQTKSDDKEEISTETKSEFCTICEMIKAVTHSCYSCSSYLCEDCEVFHSKAEMFRLHKTRRITGMHRTFISVLEYLDQCDIPLRCTRMDHGKSKAKVKFFCYDCNQYICRKCEDIHTKVPTLKSHCIDKVHRKRKVLCGQNHETKTNADSVCQTCGFMNLCTRCTEQHRQTSHIIVEIKTAEKISQEFCQMEHDSLTDASLMCTNCDSLMLCGNCADLHTKIPECIDHKVRDIPVKSKELLRHKTKLLTSDDDSTCFCAICEKNKVGDLLCYNCGIRICDECSLLYTGGKTDLDKHTFISLENMSLEIERAQWIDQGTSKRKLLIAVLKFGISTIELSLSFSKDVVTNAKTTSAAFNLTKIFQDKCSLLISFDDTYITFGSDAENKLKLLLPKYKDFEENWRFYSEFSAETNNRIQEWKKRPSKTKTVKNIVIMRNVVIQTIRKIQNKLNEDLMIRMLGIPRELIYWVIETPTGWDECFRSNLFPEIQKIGIKNTMISIITEQHASLHFFKNSETKADEIFCRPGFINVYIEGQMFYVSDVLNDNNNIIIRKTIASHLPYQFPDILRTYFGTIVFNLIPLEELRNMTKEFDKQVETLPKRGPKEIPLSSAVIKIFNESSSKLKNSTGRGNDHLDVLFENNMILIRNTYFEKVVKERIERIILKVVEMVDNRRDMQVMIIGEMFKSSYIQSLMTDFCGNLKVVFFPEPISSMTGSVISIFNQTFRNEGTDVISYDSDDNDSDSSI